MLDDVGKTSLFHLLFRLQCGIKSRAQLDRGLEKKLVPFENGGALQSSIIASERADAVGNFKPATGAQVSAMQPC